MSLQRTAYGACSRKVHCVKKKYLDDPFVTFFATDLTMVNSPLMNRGTWLRTKAIEHCVLTFARSSGACPIQIISFGAGVDTLYFRLVKDHPQVQLAAYVQLDLPDLIQQKQRVIERHASMRTLKRSQYVLAAADLCNVCEVVTLLKKHINPSLPTLLLAQMVFVYLPEPTSTLLLQAVLQDVLAQHTRVALITYDAILPHDRFGQMMVSTLRHHNVELKGIEALSTVQAHAQRCRSLGFKCVDAKSMRQLYLTVPRQIQKWLGSLQMIDDWDEWNLVHDHYCFVIAITDTEPLPQIFATPAVKDLNPCP